MEIIIYWKVFFVLVIKLEDVWIKEVCDVMYDFVKMYMCFDVLVGLFLFGGIDLLIIVVIVKEYYFVIKIFFVGFECDGFSEIDVVKEIVDKFGVENISYVILFEEYMKELLKIVWYMDDLFVDLVVILFYFLLREVCK